MPPQTTLPSSSRVTVQRVAWGTVSSLDSPVPPSKPLRMVGVCVRDLTLGLDVPGTGGLILEELQDPQQSPVRACVPRTVPHGTFAPGRAWGAAEQLGSSEGVSQEHSPPRHGALAGLAAGPPPWRNRQNFVDDCDRVGGLCRKADCSQGSYF